MDKPILKRGDRGIDDECDSVQMALHGTNNYDVEMWWLEAFRDIAHYKFPHLEDEFKEVIDHLGDAIHRNHPNIVVEKWNNRSIKW